MNLIIELLARLTPYGTQAYFIMFSILVICGFGLPMPEDVVLITGGILSARHVTEFWPTIFVTLAGVLLGDGVVFTIGKRIGPKIKQTRGFQWIVQEEREKKIMSWFNRYGDKVIFFARFAPGLRMPLFLTAGAYQVPTWKFFMLDGLAALISVPVWVWVGHFFGSNLELLEEKMKHIQMGLYGVLGGVVGLGLLIWFLRQKKRWSN
ncbi:MAG: DedA family protein [Oligoflexales bacterium]|nr:DedA family protein [Oligoflexales bacterium]